MPGEDTALAVGGSIAKLCSQKSLDKIQDTGNDNMRNFSQGVCLS